MLRYSTMPVFFYIAIRNIFHILVVIWPSTVNHNTKDVVNLQSKIDLNDEI